MRIGFIISSALGIDVGDFLIKPNFAGAYISNTFRLFLKLIFSKNMIWVFKLLIIHFKALDDVFFQPFRCPYPKGSYLTIIYTINTRYNSIEIIILFAYVLFYDPQIELVQFLHNPMIALSIQLIVFTLPMHYNFRMLPCYPKNKQSVLPHP